jgi:hypothetical protein
MSNRFQPTQNVETTPKEPSPMPFMGGTAPDGSGLDSAPPPPTEKPFISPEQEMEMMRESLERESEAKPPRQNLEKQDEVPSGGEEKHFFWE